MLLRHKIEFPILKDAGNKVADHSAPSARPKCSFSTKTASCATAGRVDDQYGFTDGVGYQRPEAMRNDLADAIGELVAGKPVGVPTTDVVGCKIGRVRQPAADAKVTYSKQIAPIFQEHCVECHRSGRIGPFSMTSYDELVGWGEMIREVVDQGRMPPWHARQEARKFANDVSLSDADKKLIAFWVDSAAPRAIRPTCPPRGNSPTAGRSAEPDQIVYMREDAVDVPAEGVIDYYHFSVDPGWKEDKWIMAAEAKRGNLETVHHILVFVQPPGSGGGGLFGLGGGGGGGGGNRGARGNDAQRSDAKGGEGRRRGGGGGFGRGGGGGGGGIGNGNLIAATLRGACRS